MNARTMTNEEFFYGHKACGGCGAALAIRLVMKVLGKRTFAVVPPNCMSTVGFIYPQMPFTCNGIIPPFAATAAVMSGIEAGARALGFDDYSVVGFAGDGGTVDIGLQALSGAIDRGDRMVYVCYDNEAYMNTGVQKSGLSPYGAKTTTTPVGRVHKGSDTSKKNIFEIITAHNIPYAATASVGYPLDLLAKVEKAKNAGGTAFLHIYSPCPTGWGMESQDTIAIAKEAVDCGLWYLAESEYGACTLNRDPAQFTSVRDYLKKQGRFSHMTEEDIDRVVAERDAKWDKIRALWSKEQK